MDTSTLTGESVPEPIGPDGGLYAGTFVVQGVGRAVVAATGGSTRFAQIARLTQSQARPRTPLEADIRRLVRTIAVVAASVGVVFFVVMLLLGVPPAQGFIFGIGVTVALVPEGLLPTVTLSLAVGAQRMADAERARAATGVRRDPRRHHGHLQRQDRHHHREPDERRGGLDPRRGGGRLR